MNNDFNFVDWCDRTNRWAGSVFGDEVDVSGVIKHLEEEVQEAADDPDEIYEWCDIIFLAVDGARRRGFTPEEIGQALEEKLQINIDRQWPSPADRFLGQPIKHIK